MLNCKFYLTASFRIGGRQKEKKNRKKNQNPLLLEAAALALGKRQKRSLLGLQSWPARRVWTLARTTRCRRACKMPAAVWPPERLAGGCKTGVVLDSSGPT
jgi:hypothetical protein